MYMAIQHSSIHPKIKEVASATTELSRLTVVSRDGKESRAREVRNHGFMYFHMALQ